MNGNGDKISFNVGGEIFDIPSEKKDKFLSKYPDAVQVESFVVEKDTFDIPVEKVDKFKSKYANAKPLFEKKNRVGTSSQDGSQVLQGSQQSPSNGIPSEPLEGLGGQPSNVPPSIEQPLRAAKKPLAQYKPINNTGEVKEFVEEDFFDGYFGASLKAIDVVSDIGIGEFIDDIGRAIAGGQKQGGSVDDALVVMTKGKHISDMDLDKWMSAVEVAQSQPMSESMYNFNKELEERAAKNKDGQAGFWDVFTSLNAGIVPEIIVSSLSAMVNPASGAAAGGVVAGSAIAGGAPGAIASVPFALAAAGTTLETAATFNELVQDELSKSNKEFTKDNVREILENEEVLNSLRAKAAGRGLAIGIVDAITGKLGGSIGANVARKGFKGAKTAALAATTTTEALGGSGGEAVGQLVAGQEISPSEIVLEGIGEIGQAPIQLASALGEDVSTGDASAAMQKERQKQRTAAAVMNRPLYELNGEIVSKEELNNILENVTDGDIEGMDIKVTNDQEMSDKAGSVLGAASIKNQVKKANPELSEESVNKITKAQLEINSLKDNDTEVAKARTSVLKAQIKQEVEGKPIVQSNKNTPKEAPTQTETVQEIPVKEPVSESETNKEVAETAPPTEQTAPPVSKKETTQDESTKEATQKVEQPQFIESLKGTPVKGPSETMAEGVFQTEVDGVDVLMSEVDDNTVKLESIRTPKKERGQGKAKAALAKITAEADKQGKVIVLDVLPENNSPQDKLPPSVPNMRKMDKSDVVDDINSRPLIHASGLGMESTEAQGTYISTEVNGNRYAKKAKGLFKAVINIANPYVVSGGDLLFEAYNKSRIQESIDELFETGIVTEDKFLLEQINNNPVSSKKYNSLRDYLSEVNAIDHENLDILGSYSSKLEAIVSRKFTEELKVKGYDSIYAPESKNTEGYLVVFDKKNVSLSKIDRMDEVVSEAPINKNTITEPRLRKLYEDAGFVADGKTSMRREPVKEESKTEESPIVVSEGKVKQAETVEEIESQIAKLREEREAYLDDFEIEKAKEADDKIIELAKRLPQEETQQEFTDEERIQAFDEKEAELRQAFKEGHAFKAIEETFTPISIAEYDAVHGKGMYNENKTLLKGLVTKEGSKDAIDNRSVETDDGGVEYFDPADIMEYIDAVAFDRATTGDTKYEVPKDRKTRRKSAPKSNVGEKVSTADFLRGLAQDVRKGKIDKDIMMSGLPGFKQALDLAIEAVAKTLEGAAYASEIIDALVAEIKKNKVFMSSMNPKMRKALDFEAMVAKEMGMSKEDYLKDKIAATDKRARERIKEAEKNARKETKEKESEKTKKKVEAAKEKATEKAKQKYVNVGYRIGEAFGKLAGEIRGKTEGRKEGRKDAAKMQKEFAKGVDRIISESILDAKKKSPGFTVSPNQLAAASRKLLSVNFNSPLSIERAVEYVDKVLNNATYANDVARTKKLKSISRKRLERNDYGIDNGLMRQALKVDHEKLSVNDLSEYMSFLEGISTGPYNKTANIDTVEKYAQLYRDQKESAQEPISEQQESANEKRKLSRDAAKQEAVDEFEFERKSMSAPVSSAYQKDYNVIKSLTQDEIDNLSENQLRELSNAIRNMRDGIGFMSGNASNTLRDIKSERDYASAKNITEGRQFKQLLRDMIFPIKTSLKGFSKMNLSDKMKNLISMMPLNRIDSAMKGVTGQQIHDTFVQPISTAFSMFTEKVNQIEREYDRLYSRIGSGLNPWKREKQRQREMVKLSFIAIQKEFESNPNNEEVSPLSDYIEAIKEAASIDEDYAKTSQDYLEIYESMLDDNGNFDYALQESKLDKNTKAFFEYAQSVNASNSEFVEVSAIRNGENVSLRDFYTPISVALIDHSDLSKIQDMANKFSGTENVKPTAQSGNIKKRTRGGKPLYLDFHNNAKRATRSVLLDYHMREPLRVASKAFNKIYKDPEISPESRAFFKGLEANIAQIVRNVFVNEYFEGAWADRAKNLIKKRGYQMALSSVPRAGVEFASNLAHVMIFKPTELSLGIKSILEYKGNDNDIRDMAIMAESSQVSRMFDKSTSVLSEQGVNTKGSSTMYGRMIDQINNSVVSKPDQAIARPLWVGSFLKTFQEASGNSLDFKEMLNNPEYRQRNEAAISKARNVADSNLSQGFASLNPFEGIAASQVTKSDNLAQVFDKYMTRFMRYEFQSSVDAINGMMGNNELTKREGAALLTATIARMALYQFAMSYAVDMFYSMIESVIGTGDDEEDDEDDALKKLNSSIVGAIITMIAFRRLGNWAKAPIAWGIETLNSRFGEEAGLRNGEYDPYKNSVVFSPIPGELKKEDLETDKILPKFSGPYGAMIKTTLRAKTLLERTGVQDGSGGFLIQPSLKNPESIEKANVELVNRIIPELIMETVGSPVPRDIRNLILRETFKDFKAKSVEEQKLSKEKSALEKEMSEYKDSVKEELKRKKKGEYVSYENYDEIPESNLGDYRKSFEGRYKELTASDSFVGLNRIKLVKEYNIGVFNDKHPELAKFLITTDGEGKSIRNMVEAAVDMIGDDITELSPEQEKAISTFLQKNNESAYLSKLKEQLKLKSKK